MEDWYLLQRYAATGSDEAFAALVLERHLGSAGCPRAAPTHGDAHLAQDVAQRVFTNLASEGAPARAGHRPARLVASGYLLHHPGGPAPGTPTTRARETGPAAWLPAGWRRPERRCPGAPASPRGEACGLGGFLGPLAFCALCPRT